MKKFVQLLELAVKLLPIIVSGVRALEEAAPVGGQGLSKAQVLSSIVASVYEEAADDLPPLQSITGLVEKIASGMVGLFKKAGIFQ